MQVVNTSEITESSHQNSPPFHLLWSLSLIPSLCNRCILLHSLITQGLHHCIGGPLEFLHPVFGSRSEIVCFQLLCNLILEQVLDDKAVIPNYANPDKGRLILNLDSLVVSIPNPNSLSPDGLDLRTGYLDQSTHPGQVLCSTFTRGYLVLSHNLCDDVLQDLLTIRAFRLSIITFIAGQDYYVIRRINRLSRGHLVRANVRPDQR